MSRDFSPSCFAAGAAILVFLPAACSRQAALFPEVPAGLPVPSPSAPLQDMELAEDYSMEIEDRLFEAARALESGDFGALAPLLAGDFRGEDLASLPQLTDLTLVHGVHRVRHDPDAAAVVDAAGFAAAFAGWLDAWGSVRSVRWDLLASDFQPGRPAWARARLLLKVLGEDAGGRPASVEAEAAAQFVRHRNDWSLRGFDVLSMERGWRARTMFTDVTGEAGVGYEGLPRGQRSFRHLRQPFNGLAVGDADGDGRWDVYAAGKDRNFLYLGRGNGRFAEAAEEWGLAGPGDGTGCVFFDYDNDGDQDLALGGEGYVHKDGDRRFNRFRLYRNDGGRFTEVAEEMGVAQYLFTYSINVADYDGDGWLDVYLCNYGAFSLNRNDAWHRAENGQRDVLLRNLGEGRGFEDVSVDAGINDTRWSFAAATADYDRDGDQDVYVVHDFGLNTLWQNQGDGTFVDVADRATTMDLGFGMSASWADLNNDGLLDIYAANMEVPAGARILGRLVKGGDGVMAVMKLNRGNTMLFQRRDGGFDLVPESHGGIAGDWAWGCLPNDFDLDGRLDVFCTNGYISREGPGDINSYFWRHVVSSTADVEDQPMVHHGDEPNSDAYTSGLAALGTEKRSWSGYEHDKLWLNRGEEGFLDVSDVSGADSRGDGRAAVAADFDDDGDLDLFLNEWSVFVKNRFLVLRNDLHERPQSFVKVRLRATTGQWQAAGAEVTVHTPHGPCSQVLSFGTGFLSSNPPELVFGLGDADSAEVEVLWPGAKRERFGELQAGMRVLLVEGTGKAAPLASQFPQEQ